MSERVKGASTDVIVVCLNQLAAEIEDGETDVIESGDAVFLRTAADRLSETEEKLERAVEARDREAKRVARCEDALRRIVSMEIPVGVGAECADWLKGVARQALQDIRDEEPT